MTAVTPTRPTITCESSFWRGPKPMQYRHPSILLKRFRWVGVALLAPGFVQAQGLLRKSCGDGITLKLNATIAAQGSLLMGEVASTKALPAITAEWDGRTVPV